MSSAGDLDGMQWRHAITLLSYANANSDFLSFSFFVTWTFTLLLLGRIYSILT